MRIKKVKDLRDLEPGTRVLVTICIPEDNRYEMYTGTIDADGPFITYDDGKSDATGVISFYQDNGWATARVLEV